ncbi:MAG: hypothetical protein J5781_02375, partial [Clostridia bacterium]|nr:hypothetical protein [Clostridia bacterium]
MKKAMRKMIPAVIMLLISAMLVGTSTYAWFSMNKTVTVTGMTVKAKGTDNVMIADATAVEALNLPTESAESLYAYGLDQSRKGNLQPASSIDGVSYYYTDSTNVNANGAARTANYTAYAEETTLSNSAADKSNYDTGFNSNYGITGSVTTDNVAYAYIDYSLYIKATNAADSAQNLRLSRCNLLYNNAAIANTAKAWRVAVFAKRAGTEGNGKDTKVTDDVAVGNLKAILSLAGAHYFSYSVGDPTEKAVDNAPSTLAAVTNFGSAATLGSIAAGKTDYYKVTIRLWLEGEDTTCKNDTFASLSGDWTLDLAFALDESTGVTAIGSVATTTVTGADT